MSGEKYPAKLVEKVARAICKESHMPGLSGWDEAERDEFAADFWLTYQSEAIAALDAIPYAAMREALENVRDWIYGASYSYAKGDIGKDIESVLRAADGEET